MAFPTTSVIDDFNRANASDLGSNWTRAFNFGVASNRLTVASNRATPPANFYGEDAYTAASYGPDSEAYATLISTPAAGGDFGVFARYTGPNASAQGYRLAITAAGSWQVSAYTGGSTTPRNIGSAASQAVAAGDSFGMEVTGTGATVTIKLYHKPAAGSWTLLATVTDTHANRITGSGNVGVYSFNNGSGGALDDFGGGTVVAGGEQHEGDSSNVGAGNATADGRRIAIATYTLPGG
jgi:hypothetical protein